MSIVIAGLILLGLVAGFFYGMFKLNLWLLRIIIRTIKDELSK